MLFFLCVCRYYHIQLPCPALRRLFFFFNDTATTEIYTLSLHDALPISSPSAWPGCRTAPAAPRPARGSEEHTFELQSRENLVCRLLLEKKKKTAIILLSARKSIIMINEIQLKAIQ